MKVCEERHFLKIKYLVDNVSYAKYHNNFNDIPLIYAFEQGNIDIIKRLVEYGEKLMLIITVKKMPWL